MTSFKVLLKIGFTAILAFLLQTVFPWWSIVIASFLINFIISTKGLSSFVAGFLAIAFLWFMLAAYSDMKTGSILTTKVAAILFLPSNWTLIFVTSVVGGFAGGFAALTGSYLRSWILPAETN